MLKRVISGGQTGADQAGLIVAERFGFTTGGWMPHGWRTLDGPNPELAARFNLQEHPEGYAERTGANVRDSDGTLRIAGTFSSRGERCTLRWLEYYGRPYFDVRKSDPPSPEEVIAWLDAHAIEVLNVAGNAEATSTRAKAHGITDFAIEYLMRVFTLLDERIALAG